MVVMLDVTAASIRKFHGTASVQRVKPIKQVTQFCQFAVLQRNFEFVVVAGVS